MNAHNMMCLNMNFARSRMCPLMPLPRGSQRLTCVFDLPWATGKDTAFFPFGQLRNPAVRASRRLWFFCGPDWSACGRQVPSRRRGEPGLGRRDGTAYAASTRSLQYGRRDAKVRPSRQSPRIPHRQRLAVARLPRTWASALVSPALRGGPCVCLVDDSDEGVLFPFLCHGIFEGIASRLGIHGPPQT